MTAVISKFDCVARIGLIICLNAISDARAETGGSVKLDEIAFAFANELIKKGQIVADGKGAWSEHRPSAIEENEFIRAHGFREYAKWHLGNDHRFPENSKRRYKFPYGNFKVAHRCGYGFGVRFRGGKPGDNTPTLYLDYFRRKSRPLGYE